MRRTRFHALVCVWAAGTIAAGGCRAPRTQRIATSPMATTGMGPAPAAPARQGGRATVPIDANAPEGALAVRLPDPKVASAGAVVTELSLSDTQALLGRLEPLPDLSRAPAPTMRAPSAPPPRPGPAQPIAFVVPSGKAVADAPGHAPAVSRPLTRPQISPQDEVTAEAVVRIRFDEAMVPVAQVGAVAKPPAAIAPVVPGTWRWVDTRVLTFTAASARLPAATAFVVTVPPGARALSGATLGEEAKATFSTPPVAIAGTFPSATLRPDSPVVIQFNQAIDPARVLPLLRITSGKARLAFHTISLADAEALWRKNPSLGLATTRVPDLGVARILIAPTTTWPAGAVLQAALDPGAPSIEGPRLSVKPSFATFEIAKPFTVRGITCDEAYEPRMTGRTCAALGDLQLWFTNTVEPSSYRSSKVQIEGGAFQDTSPSGAATTFYAPREVGRAFTFAIGDDLIDVYGQPLVGPKRPAFSTSRERFSSWMTAPSGLLVLDPRFAIPQWVIVAEAVAAVRVELYQVQPADYFKFEAYEQGTRATPPGKRISDKTFAVGARSGVHVRVDLRPALNPSGLGHVIAVATAAPLAGQPRDQRPPRTVAWIQVTKLGMSARLDGDKASAWVQDITPTSFLRPTAGISTSIVVDGRAPSAPVISDAEGHATVELLPPTKVAPGAPVPGAMLQMASATDSTFVAIDGSYEKAIRTENALWYVTDDRFTYKPGEKVYVKGWVRWTHSGVNPALALPATADTIAYALADARGNRLAAGTAKLSDQGGFDVEVALPANANLGAATFTFTTRNVRYRHPISIQEFRTPAYAVTLDDDVTHGGATPLILGERIEMKAEAKYYAGGGLTGAAIRWDATLEAASYRPPGWDSYSFDPVQPRGAWHHDASKVVAHQDGSLSGASSAASVWGIAALPASRPSLLTVDATVTDVDRMTIRATSRAILVHPSAAYVGIRQQPTTDDALEIIVTDIDGAAVPGVAIQIEIEGVLGSERYRDDAKVVDTQRCQLTSGTGAAVCRWKRRDSLTAYTATAHVVDARGRRNVAYYPIPWYSADDQQSLSVVPDRARYRPGDVAKLDLRSAVIPATAVVSVARHGMIAQHHVALTKPSTIVELPIEPAYIQNVNVVVDRIATKQHPDPGSALPVAEESSVALSIPVDMESARLVMTARPLTPLVEPGDMATFEVLVQHDDKPQAGAEVALIVVDEAVLALSAKVHADPLAPFYFEIEPGIRHTTTFPMVQDAGETLDGAPGLERYSLLDRPRGMGASGYGTGGGGMLEGASGGATNVIVKARKDLRANAAFSPVLHTDASGKVRLSVKMPDSLTRFRVVALATAETRYFGKAEGTIVTQRKVNARTVAPRFLSQGDTFSLPVVVQNLDGAPRTVEVAVRAANLVAVGPSGKRVTVPAGQRAEVRFDFTTRARGRAVVQTIATSGAFADASTVELPVYEPATTESFATYGTVDDAAQFEQLAVPADLFRDVGGVEVEVASTQLQSLTDAFWYLYAYPYECAEQRSARMLATAAMSDILEAFAYAGRPERKEIEAQLATDLKRLAKEQRPDGGWGYFDGMTSDPFVTMQVLSALAAHHARGAILERAVAFVTKQASSELARLEHSVATPAAQRLDRGELPYRVSLAAAALAALAASGADVQATARRLHAAASALGTYPIDAKAQLLSIVAHRPAATAMRAKLLADLLSATQETASSATVTTSYLEAERLLLVSSTKTSALALDALMREVPEHAIVSKLARGVLAGRHNGRWGSTQENVVVLMAMRRYFDRYEQATPSYTGKLWFGNAAYAEQAFIGRSGVRATAKVDWAQLAPGSTQDLALVKDGTGRMYYRVGITYAPKQTHLAALDAGFVVRRSYTAIDDPGDVRLGKDDRWTIKLGARVQVTVEVLNTTRRYGVAVVDPLPAGFEAVNDDLATSERSVAGVTDTRWDHRNMRDHRSEVFAMELREGSHQFTYTARASTPGTFIAAPAKAEEMYSPETFGRSTGQTVVIE